MALNIVGLILEAITGSTEPIPYLYERPYAFINRYRKWERKSYSSALADMKKRGLIKIFEENGKKFVECTKKGQLQALVSKAILPREQKWDGQWRLIIFDIPESSREKRDELRWLLKKNNFTKLQASVFISPNPLNREAIIFLKKTGLQQFIRILRVAEIDDDKDLKKRFNLK